MAFAEVEGDRIIVRTELRDKDLIRAVPGARYDPEQYTWHLPLSWAGCLTLRGLFGDRLEIGQTLYEWASRQRSEVIDPAMFMRTQTEATPLELENTSHLYPFQHAGVRFLSHIRRALLTDDMGTGKTLQSITTLRQVEASGEDVFPVLISAPNSMKSTWRKEFQRWWPEVKVEVLEGGRTEKLKIIDRVRNGESQVLIANWESLRHHSRLAPYGSVRLKGCEVCDPSLRDEIRIGELQLAEAHKALSDTPDDDSQGRALATARIHDVENELKVAKRKNGQQVCEHCKRELNAITWRSVIADEAHRAKDPKAKQTRALWALRTDETIVRLALTGTPIANAPEDLWSSLHFIDPKSWPTRVKYIDRWCLQTYNPFGGMTIIGLKPETKAEFFAITDPHVRRMPKSLVLTQLPPKVYSTRYVEMSPKQSKAYRAMADSMVAQVGDIEAGVGDRVVAVNPLTQLTRLTQFASAYAEMDDDQNVRLTDPSNKIDALMDLFEEVGDSPIVVFAQSRQLIELSAERLKKAGMTYGLIVGGQSSDERQRMIDQFQDGRLRAILCTVQAGGVGLTLTRANTLVFLQRSWSNIDNKQAEDRVHRIGSEVHESINIIDIVSRGTIEEGQRLALDAKQDRLQEVLRDAELVKRMTKGEEIF